jgi:hypothetical protein
VKYCSNCGKAGVEGMKFCPQCGQSLTGADSEEQRYVSKPEAARRGVATDVDYAKPRRFDPINKRTQLLLWLLVILVVLDVGAVFSDLAQAELINRAIMGQTVTEAEALANDNRQAAIGAGQTVLYIAYLVVFLMWIYRADKNLRSLRAAGLSFTPGWAVGWFFVPFMNLFRPYQVVSEIWKASDPKVDTTDDTSWKAVATAPIVGCWWVLFLISTFVANITLRLAFGGMELSDLLQSTYAYMVSDGIDVVYLLTTVFMVRWISQFQEAKAKLIGSTFDKNTELSPDNANAYTRQGLR